MSNSAPRMTLKQQTVEDQRRRMNQRRHDLTEQIRKKKRAQLIDLKRRYIVNPSNARVEPSSVVDVMTKGEASSESATTAVAMEDTSSKIENIAWSLIHNKDAASLSLLQTALAKPDVDANDLFISVMDSRDDSPALLLANTLTSFVTHTSTNECLLACRILTNLAAAERRKTDEGYYGRQPEGWCDVLMQSQAVPVIIETLAHFSTLSQA